MSKIIFEKILKYSKNSVIMTLKNINNYFLYGMIHYLSFNRFLIENMAKVNLSYLLEKSNYQLYLETIDIDYIKSDCGKELLLKLAKTNNFCEKISLKYDEDIKFVSFCSFKNIKTLYLNYFFITDSAIFHLSKCDFKMLQNLSLAYSLVTDHGIKYLIDCNFTQIKIISLESTQITDKAIEYLIICNFEYLMEIDLKSTKITDKAIEIITKGDFKQLEIIDLYGTKITTKIIQYFINTSIKFKKISLYGTAITSAKPETKSLEYPNFLFHL